MEKRIKIIRRRSQPLTISRSATLNLIGCVLYFGVLFLSVPPFLNSALLELVDTIRREYSTKWLQRYISFYRLLLTIYHWTHTLWLMENRLNGAQNSVQCFGVLNFIFFNKHCWIFQKSSTFESFSIDEFTGCLPELWRLQGDFSWEKNR